MRQRLRYQSIDAGPSLLQPHRVRDATVATAARRILSPRRSRRGSRPRRL